MTNKKEEIRKENICRNGINYRFYIRNSDNKILKRVPIDQMGNEMKRDWIIFFTILCYYFVVASNL